MHFYSDANIYGLNEIKLMNYRFRKNLDPEKMLVLEKLIFQDHKTESDEEDEEEGVVTDKGFDMVILQKVYPSFFSPMM
jgi:hypothetical protein